MSLASPQALVAILCPRDGWEGVPRGIRRARHRVESGAVTDQPGQTPIRVFISYAHDSDPHVEEVRRLWLLLRECGIDAKLDLVAAEQPQDWGGWMSRQAREADFVLAVVSPAYRRRAEGTEEIGKGLGAGWEA